MVQILLASSFITLLSILFYRYSFPYPKSEYISLFLLLFSLGFASNLYSRAWGRVWIVVGSICLVRLGAWSEILTTIPDWTTLHPLFLGGIWGLLGKEFNQLKSRPGQERLSVGYVHWVFLFFLMVLGVERFLEYNPSYNLIQVLLSSGSIFPPDSLIYQNMSNRQAFQLTWMVIDSILPAIYYFSLDDIFRRDGDNPVKDYLFGLWIAFLAQAIVIWIQTFLQPTAFMQDTGMSIDAGRVAGLFKDSGSASWIYPTIGIYLYFNVQGRKGQILERNRLLLLGLIYILIALGGVKLGRNFWFIFGIFSFIIAVQGFLTLLPGMGTGIRILVTGLGLVFVGSIFYSLLWFGEYQTKIAALQRSSKEWKIVLETGSLSRIDANRVGLFVSSWELFRSSPVFGNGLGSLIVELKRPESKLDNKPPNDFVDSPSNFYVGWLGDSGLLGLLVLGIYVGLNGYIRKSWGMYMLLVLPLMTGFQIVHSDGGFFFCFLLLASKNYERIRWKIVGERYRIVWFIVGIGVSLHYLAFALLKNP